MYSFGVKDILFSQSFHVKRIHPLHHTNRFWTCSDDNYDYTTFNTCFFLKYFLFSNVKYWQRAAYDTLRWNKVTMALRRPHPPALKPVLLQDYFGTISGTISSTTNSTNIVPETSKKNGIFGGGFRYYFGTICGTISLVCSRLVTNTRQAPVCVILRDACCSRRSCHPCRLLPLATAAAIVATFSTAVFSWSLFFCRCRRRCRHYRYSCRCRLCHRTIAVALATAVIVATTYVETIAAATDASTAAIVAAFSTAAFRWLLFFLPLSLSLPPLLLFLLFWEYP